MRNHGKILEHPLELTLSLSFFSQHLQGTHQSHSVWTVLPFQEVDAHFCTDPRLYSGITLIQIQKILLQSPLDEESQGEAATQKQLTNKRPSTVCQPGQLQSHLICIIWCFQLPLLHTFIRVFWQKDLSKAGFALVGFCISTLVFVDAVE